MKASWPTNGSVMILNASAENGAESDASRSTWVSSALRGSRPMTGGMSTGDGR